MVASLVGGEDLARRIVRSVEQDQLGAVSADRGAQRVGIEHVSAVGVGSQQHRHGPGAGECNAGLVAVVHRLEHDDLVARVEHAEQRSGKGLRGSGGDHDLARRVEFDAVEPPLVIGDRAAQAPACRARVGTD